MDSTVSFRFATESDVSTLLTFINELAKYERLPHEVVATESSLRATLFGEKPYAEAVFAEIEEAPVAFALFFHNYSTFLGRPGLYLEDLFVLPANRGLGIGKRMMGYLAQIALERGCGRLEWWVLDWNDPAIEFYKSLGARPMSDWTVMRVDGEQLRDLATGP